MSARSHASAGTGALQALLDPAAVVVVGASTSPGKLGTAMAESLRTFGRPVALVNPRGTDGMHRTVADAAAATDAPLDLALLCIPAAACPDALEECGRAGVRAALVCAGGFAETGAAGAALQQRLADVADRWDIRLLGPNTSGFVVPAIDLRASFVPGVGRLSPGDVAVVAASGGLNHALMFALQRTGDGVHLGIGIGAGVGVDAVDVLRHLADDDGARAVALHLENVADGPALLDAVRRVSARKPIAALVVGEHDLGEFAASHTGALATSWRTTRDLLRQAGAVVVDDEDALVAATTSLAAGRLAPSPAPGVALVTAQAGPGLLVTDELLRGGLHLPALDPAVQERLEALLGTLTHVGNPVDTGRPGPRHAEVLTAVAGDPAVDLVGAYALTEPVVDLPASVDAADLGDVPVLIGLDGPAEDVELAAEAARKKGLAAQVGARRLATGLRAVHDDARMRHLAEGAEAERRHVDLPQSAAWDEALAKMLLDELGVPTPGRRLVTDAVGARTALRELGAPVVVKICDPAVLHKTEVGGVVAGVRTDDDLEAALARLLPLGAPALLVEAQSPDGIDLIVGARRDPVFGPVVLLGLGGVTAEADPDVAIAAFPATTRQLAALPERLRAATLLDGFRGAPAVDRDDLAHVLAALGGLLVDHPAVDEVEVNPLRATPAGLIALDALVVTGRPTPEER